MQRSESSKKRFRLGTKSCTECRRRKVRCVYSSHSSICQQCEAHSADCQQQGVPVAPRESGSNESNDELNCRIRQLEHLVDELCKTSSLTTGFPGQISHLEALKFLCPSYSSSTNGAHEGQPCTEGESNVSVPNGPLVALLRRVLSIEDASPLDTTRPISTERCGPTMRALRALKPDTQDLRRILQLTEPYWPLWPVLPPGCTPTYSLAGTGKEGAITFIERSFETVSPEVLAKATLWLALCVQQLPSSFDDNQHSLPCLRNVLCDAYISGAERLLEGPYDGHTSIIFLECLMLEAKLYINAGRPRKSFLAVRRAINSLLLQGPYPSRDDNTPATKTIKEIWLQAFTFDRQLSMFLGTPYSVPNSYEKYILLPEPDLSALFHQQIAIVAGLIGDRNLNIAETETDYTTMARIEHELVTMREIMPTEWDLPLSLNLSVKEVFTQQIGKFYYNLLLKNTHFPYMLRTTSKSPAAGEWDLYSNSRSIALGASRRMIEHYHGLRNSPQGELLICDLMDFQVFGAAIVLVINLMSPVPGSDPLRDLQDWGLVEELTECLQRLANAMTCDVARQAAEVLDYLHDAAHGRYMRDQASEVVIPYFGKVRIKYQAEQGSASSDLETCDLPPAFNAIDFHAQLESPGMLGQCLGDAELRADWSAPLDLEYDWGWDGVFQFQGQI